MKFNLCNLLLKSPLGYSTCVSANGVQSISVGSMVPVSMIVIGSASFAFAFNLPWFPQVLFGWKRKQFKKPSLDFFKFYVLNANQTKSLIRKDQENIL